MEIAGFILMMIGIGIAVWGDLRFLAIAFRKSAGWFLACLFIPFAELLFLALHWRETKKAFWIQISGIAVIIFGIYVANGFSVSSKSF